LAKPRDVAQWCRYLEKGGDFERFGDITDDLYETFCKENADKPLGAPKKTMVWFRLTEHLQGGMTLEQAALHEDYKSVVAQNVKKLKEYVNFMRSIQEPMDPAAQFRHLSCTIKPDQWSYSMAYLMHWFNGKDQLGNRQRAIREKQLWLIAPFGSGKTTLVTALSKHLRIYHMPNEDFYCTWDDEKFDICIIDEFHGNKPIGFLNSWLDGSHLQLKVKGGQTYLKKFNIPTIIISNFDPNTCYHKALQENAQITGPLKDRVEVLSLSTPEVRSLGICTEGDRVHIINDEVDDTTGCAKCSVPPTPLPDADVFHQRVLANMGAPFLG